MSRTFPRRPATTVELTTGKGIPVLLATALTLIVVIDRPAAGAGPSVLERRLNLEEVTVLKRSSAAGRKGPGGAPDEQGLSLASADFDDDGIADLVIGERTAGGGRLRMLRGNAAAIYPHLSEQTGAGTDPFLPREQTIALARAPEWLGAGDFDGDGHVDLVAAGRDGAELLWLPGTGTGRFGEARRLDLARTGPPSSHSNRDTEGALVGTVTLLAVADVNRSDNLPDLLVGIDGQRGPELLVFEHAAGALDGDAEALPMPGRVTDVAAGLLDEGPFVDLAVVAGGQLHVVHGRDRRTGAEPVSIELLPTPVAVHSLALGDFLPGAKARQIAVLGEDGAVRLLSADGEELTTWHAEVAGAGARLQPTRMSSLPSDELLVLGSGAPRLLASRPGTAGRAAAVTPTGVEPVAIVAMRLNPDALDDLVLLGPGGELHVLVSRAAAIFTVNSTISGPDFNPGDGICETVAVPPPNICTLQAAVEESNALPGADEIRFNIGGGGPQTILQTLEVIEITDAVSIRGDTQPGFTGDPVVGLTFGSGLLPGLGVKGDNVLIRALAISGFSLEGISLFNDNAVVEGNWLGLDLDGVPDNNLRGIGVGGDNNLIGGVTAAARNVISGNFDRGVAIGPSGTGNRVEGNYIGTDPTGTVAFGNGDNSAGVKVDGDDNTVGGTLTGTGNLISGNNNLGVWIGDGDSNKVQGNKIGTDPTGTTALPNIFAGVFVSEGDFNTIGGPMEVGNLISGNAENLIGDGGSGVMIAGSVGSMVQGNLIGTDVTGKLPLGNERHGVHVLKFGTDASEDVLIGGFATADALGNVIGANGHGSLLGHGILVEESEDTKIHGNWIGTDKTAVKDLGNLGDGIRLVESRSSEIGGPELPLPAFGRTNFITNNLRTGIAVHDLNNGAGSQNSNDNRIWTNSIWNNGALGIDLTRGGPIPDGPTANDADDPDHGPNRLQNMPVITDVATTPGFTTISAILNSTPSTDFIVELFTSDACDPSGFGEGKTYLGKVDVTTSGAGDVGFQFQTTQAVAVITATASAVTSAPLFTHDTSELSECWTPSSGLLGDYVWSDENGDGLQQRTEPGVAGVTVRLLTSTDVEIDTTVTDINGNYLFRGVASGTYKLELGDPDGGTFTVADAGDDTLDSDVDPATGQTPLFAYTEGSLELGWDAGISAVIFTDGFESGDTSAWSASLP